ncbi:hypothetical protein OAM27_01050 [Candidatus Pelagibacter sp.]|jgi:hypothetical protein|nr:hypothetical protein [Candidatus Pelagibacter sp.]MDC0406790.1 hypothetical protein [Candidatus Pelagibacter sp.]MDC0895493.1 hypothetical protein [Candidatus Pelagibacter sp.]MDC0901095.1 hypothetical protein [Candidatus Pelagibacter sp.]MDC0922371.1 hypothetical protein [Candidatus Pelagibacter sp.]|tara:strand:- start:435 stop:1148 length:714 start_codon:yes stop_codon:yes gene_type:complete
MKKFLSIIAIFTLSFYILVEFIGDRLIKNILEDNISISLNREVSIKKLTIDYLNGEARANNIKILNKKFKGNLAEVDFVKVNLDTFSIFSNDILINDIQLNNINLNYYFKFSDRITSDNLRNLQQDLEFKNTDSQSSKYFNIKNLDAKNINLAVLSSDFDFEKIFSINDMNFKDIGNTKDSKNYKDILKKVFKDMVVDVREKIMSNNLLDAVKNLDIKQIEDKVKDKLKNKLKGLIN